MFTCCLCGKTYATEKEVVKCVNRCGRALPHIDKEIPSYEVENVISDLPPQDFLNQLKAKGVSNEN